MIRTASALVAIAGLAQPALAQNVCASRDVLVSSLLKDYSETPTALGMSDNGAVIEVLSTRDGATWTILMTTPDGQSCVVATGEAWEPVEPQVATLGNEA